jgi:hypothetical protein
MKDLTLKYEEQGREMMTKVCQEQIVGCSVRKLATNRHAHWDMAITIMGKPYIVEIKVREYVSNAYNDWYYQVDKHNQLLKLKVEADKKKETKILYVNFFTDDAFRMWDTTEIHKKQQPKTVLTQQTTTTERDSWVPTPVYLVSLDNEYLRGEVNPYQFEDNREDPQTDLF